MTPRLSTMCRERKDEKKEKGGGLISSNKVYDWKDAKGNKGHE